MSPTSKTPISAMVFLVALISLVPVFHVGSLVGNSWRGVVPEYIEDSSYYYARVNDVVRGHYLIGNPYFIEHKDSIPPAFFLSDIIDSLPYFVMPFSWAVVFNIVLWSEVFVLLLYVIFRRLGFSETISPIFPVLMYVQAFWLFVRPVSMQTIFPAYLLFLLALFLWLKDDQNTTARWFLLASSVFAIYVYTYLMQIIVITYGVVFLYLIFNKQKEKFQNLLKLSIVLALACIPFAIITWFQINDPLYLETIKRIGLLDTHIPRMEFYYYGRWIVLTLVLWFLSRRWMPSLRDEENNNIFKFFLITGLSLLIASGSNIITGKELEIANHMGRFVIVWFPMAFLSYLYIIFQSFRGESVKVNIYQKIVLGVLILIGCFAMIRNIPRAFPFFRNSSESMTSLQSYAGPLNWLVENIDQPVVVWADIGFSGYVPIYTNNYVLFHPSGVLQLVSDNELEDRYLVSKFLSLGPSREDVERDVGLYGGAGKALKGPVMQEHFDYIYNHYQEDIRPNVIKFLEYFRVEYIVVDLENNTEMTGVKKLSTQEVYNDGHFVIYKILKPAT